MRRRSATCGRPEEKWLVVKPRRSAGDELSCEIVAHRFDFVGEQDDPLAAVEVDREELAAEVLAPRDESAGGVPSNDSGWRCDGGRRPAARSWNE